MSTDEQARHIQELIGEIDALADPHARELLQECLQSVLALHGTGLERILALLVADAQLRQQVIDDSVVRTLLFIHGLHPIPLENRLRQALEKVQPYMRSHGGNVELVSLADGVAMLRLQGHCQTCPSSAVTLELAIRAAIEEFCPDLHEMKVEGVAAVPELSQTTSWTVLNELGAVHNGDLRLIDAAGVPLIICNVNDSLYAYRNLCPVCRSSFAGGEIRDGRLCCQTGHRYDVKRAGSCLDNPALHLDPFPLLTENGTVKVAVG